MGTITTRAEQMRAGRLARRVGGYEELVRLAGRPEQTASGASSTPAPRETPVVRPGSPPPRR